MFLCHVSITFWRYFNVKTTSCAGWARRKIHDISNANANEFFTTKLQILMHHQSLEFLGQFGFQMTNRIKLNSSSLDWNYPSGIKNVWKTLFLRWRKRLKNVIYWFSLSAHWDTSLAPASHSVFWQCKDFKDRSR